MQYRMVRLRIAPSPTGFPHIGTVYQALFNFSYAKRNKGKFIVRIEDTDRERYVVGAEEKIFEALDWFSLPEDESSRKDGSFSPYRQSERLSIYQKYSKELVEKGHAYYCFCSKERLDELRKKLQSEKKQIMYDKHCRNILLEESLKKVKEGNNWVIRLKIPENKKIIVKDEIRGDVIFDSNTIDDQVLLKSDGFPTYHLAVVIDDHLMEITHVVRAEEWLSSTPKHVLLYDYFNWEKPFFFHTPTLRNPDKSKLSKRHGHTNVDWYKENGFLPQAILNFLALMGWSHPEGKEIFSLSEFINLFDLKDIKPAGPIFDLKKLEWMNGLYIRQLAIEELSLKLKTQSEKIENIDDKLLNKFISLAQSRMVTLNDFEKLVIPYFEKNKTELNQKDIETAELLKQKFMLIKNWDQKNILQSLKEILEENKIKMPIIYKIMTGEQKGLPLPEALEIIGFEKTLEKLNDITK